MAATPEIEVSQADTAAVVYGVAPEIEAGQADVVAVFNYPSERVDVSQAEAAFVADVERAADVSQVDVIVVMQGRVANPRVRAWSYSMDGHDFYVLQLGERGTLVYDITTGQWAEWKSQERATWRACSGTNWTGIGAGALAGGSPGSAQDANVIAGDDTFGLLWFLAPEQGYDENPHDRSELPFERIATGGLPMRMRQTARCNEVYILASKGQASLAATAQTISLRTSDDAERSWTDQGTITVSPQDWGQEFAFRSLGLIQSPGRVFRVEDNHLARIDGMEMR
jgi:hypothetical protein